MSATNTLRPETERLISQRASRNIRAIDRLEEPTLNPREIAEREARFLQAFRTPRGGVMNFEQHATSYLFSATRVAESPATPSKKCSARRKPRPWMDPVVTDVCNSVLIDGWQCPHYTDHAEA